jgi:hypothetical protein
MQKIVSSDDFLNNEKSLEKMVDGFKIYILNQTNGMVRRV